MAPPVVTTPLSGYSSTAALATQIANLLVAAGWTLHASISGGVTLLGTSPQGYSVYLDVTAQSAGVAFQLHSSVGSGCTGYQHIVAYDTGSYLLTAFPCGWFLSRPGITSSPAGSACCGGIPSVATNCGISTALGTITEIWFSFGDYVASFFEITSNPRINLDVLGGVNTGTQSGCLNGVMAIMGSSSPWDVPEILRLSPASADGPHFPDDSSPLWYGEQPLIYAPFVSWPNSHASPILIRGQLYNALVLSSENAAGDTQVISGYNFINYTDAYFWGGVWVLESNTPPPSGSGNYAY